MKYLLFAASAAIISASLASCDSQVPVERPAAYRDPTTPPPSSAKAAEPFRSSITPNSAPDGASVADAELGNKVKGALTSAKDMEIAGVEVEAANGVVTLYGTVEVSSEKDRAAFLALGIDGVRSVVNNLVVIRGS